MALILDLEKDLLNIAGGPRLPNDPFFKEGNRAIPHLKKYGIFETDQEDFLHELVELFKCSIFGCHQSLTTIFQFEQHYNCCHRYTCIECKKTLATPHLLDLHVSESHDSYFAALSEKKPMFQCYVEDCKMFYNTPQLRKAHCIKEHSFPSSFWCDKQNSSNDKPQKTLSQGKTSSKPKLPKANSKHTPMDEMAASASRSNEDPEQRMDVAKANKSDVGKSMEVAKPKKPAIVKSLGCAAHGRRKQILSDYTKDLADCLTEISAVNKPPIPPAPNVDDKME